MTTFLIILALIVVFVVVVGRNGNKQSVVFEKKYGTSMIRLKDFGRYVGGHPDIDNTIEKTLVDILNGELTIFSFGLPPIYKSKIPMNQIKSVEIEDESAVTKRVTVGRLLAVGVFAFAWKKKKLEEHVYVVIEWNDGRFDHETIFEFEGKGSRQSGNTIRNWLIKELR